MESVITNLKSYSNSKRLMSAEQLIMSKITDLDPYINADLIEEKQVQIEEVLLSLFKINGGNLSVQCSLFIASKLLKMYQVVKKSQLWELINMAINAPSTSTIIATGYVIRFYGHNSKSQLPRFIESLFKQNGSNEFAVAYSLRCVYKTKSKTVEKYIPQALEFAKKVVLKPKQATIIAGLKLLKVLITYSNVNYLEIYETIKLMLKADTFPFIKNTASSLIAKCLFIPLSVVLSNNNDAAEFAVSQKKSARNNPLSGVFDTIMSFPSISSFIVTNFLNLLSPRMIEEYSDSLFHYIRKNSVSNLEVLIPLIPEESRLNLIEGLLKEPHTPEQLKLLVQLSRDDIQPNVVSSIALRLATSLDKKEREYAQVFFDNFSKQHQKAASSLVLTCLEKFGNSEIESYGYACVLRTILNRLSYFDDSLHNSDKRIIDIVEKSLMAVNINEYMFSSCFVLLSSKLNLQINKSIVESAINTAISQFSKSNSLKRIEKRAFKWIFIYLSVHPDTKFVNSLISISIKCMKKINGSILNIFDIIIKSIKIDKELSYGFCKYFIQSLVSLKVSTDIIKSFMRKNLPTGNDLLKINTEMTYEQENDQKVITKSIKTFPLIYKECDELDQYEIIKYLMASISTQPISLLLLISLCQTEYCKTIPISIINFFFQQLDTKSVTHAQLVAEALSSFIKYNPSLLSSVMDYIEFNPTPSSCLLLNSLVYYNRLNQEQLFKSVLYINIQLRNSNLVPFASNALASLLITHSMALEPLGLMKTEMNELFSVLHTNTSFQPVALHLLSEAFSLLIEHLSIELSTLEKSLVSMVSIFIDSVRLTPVYYAKEAYYKCIQSIYTFVHPLNHITSLSFPSYLGATNGLLLSACDTYIGLSRFQSFDIKLSIFPKLLTLLQVSNDIRVSNFIISIVNNIDNNEFWIAQIRRILLQSSLLDITTNSIEPAALVKICFLEICGIILARISNKHQFSTEILDDIIAVSSKYSLVDNQQLQAAAYNILKMTVDLFQDVNTEEGNMLLELYEVQFLQSVKAGFSIDLDVSGKFLLTYLSFITKRSSISNSQLVSVYFTGLSECRQRSAPYFSIATHLCVVARNEENESIEVPPIFMELVPVFAEVVFQSMKIWETPSDWKPLKSFRDYASSFYQDLLPSFVWLQKHSSIVIPQDVLIGFFLHEIICSRESWIVAASFDALNVLVEFFGDSITCKMLELILQIVLPMNNHIIMVRKIFVSCSRFIQPTEEYDSIRSYSCYYLSQSLFDPIALAYIIRSDSKKSIVNYAQMLFELIYEKYHLSNINGIQYLALCYLMIDQYHEKCGSFLRYLLKINISQSEIKQDIVIRCMVNAMGDLPIEEISRYCIETFRRGGMNIVACILSLRPEIGISLLSKGCAKAAFLVSQKDLENNRTYTLFLNHCLNTIKGNDLLTKSFADAVSRLCHHLVITKGKDQKFGYQLTTNCVSLLRISNSYGNGVYDELSSQEKADFISIVESIIEKTKIKKKSSKLATFSVNQWARKADEWQMLEIESFSDGSNED